MIAVNVKGGTHAGWKMQKQAKPWEHDCPMLYDVYTADGTFVKRHAGTITLATYSCAGCGARRDASR